MDHRPQNEATVTFPATDAFSRIGRVYVAGLALRLSIDISAVEELRVTADAAVKKLGGPGRITIKTQWSDVDLVVRLENLDADLDQMSDIDTDPADNPATVETIVEPPHRIFLRIDRDIPALDEEE